MILQPAKTGRARHGYDPPMLSSWRALLLGAVAAAIAAATGFLPPMPQPEAYHAFAETRRVLGIPHFNDVVSNLAFVAVGILGLAWLLRHRRRLRLFFVHPVESLPYAVVFTAIVLVGIGSAYYHWEPSHPRLYWDRLAMTLAFMAIFAAILAERIDYRVGLIALPVLVLLGMVAATHWLFSELDGAGDLRLYLLAQIVPLVFGALLIRLYRSPYSRGGDFVAAGGWYLLALVAQTLDQPIHALTGGWLSGHTLKHLLAAVAVYWILRMLRLREIQGERQAARGTAGPTGP